MAHSLTQYLTYQHNVQKYFDNHRDKYGGIIIPLSIATAFPAGTYGFVRALCAKDASKRYAIDPRDALFQKSWNRSNVREPHRKMAKALGEPFESVGLTRALEPADFRNDDVLDEAVRLCLDFQKNFRARDEEARKLEKYRKLLGVVALGELSEPQVLIPPYFQFERIDDQWYSTSMRCVAASVRYAGMIPVRPVVHFGTWATAGRLGGCYTALRGHRIESVWLYPNLFKEHDAAETDLRLYRKAVEDARAEGVEPFVLFGGYFAILLSMFGLSGFGNGIGYGEWRDSGYHRGGTAATRIYILKLHQFLDAPAAQSLIDRDQEYFGEDTDIIAEWVQSGRPLDEMKSEQSLDHFMECRKLEMDFVATHSVGDVREELAQTIAHLDPMPLERDRFGKSLARWLAAIG